MKKKKSKSEEADTQENPFELLHRVFHEPSRLAIMSAVAQESKGVKFRDLRDECNLTDGNLNRHLKTLEEAGAVKIKKKFVDSKPQTTIHITRNGEESFLEYLQALQHVLVNAAESLGADELVDGLPMNLGKLAEG